MAMIFRAGFFFPLYHVYKADFSLFLIGGPFSGFSSAFSRIFRPKENPPFLPFLIAQIIVWVALLFRFAL